MPFPVPKSPVQFPCCSQSSEKANEGTPIVQLTPLGVCGKSLHSEHELQQTVGKIIFWFEIFKILLVAFGFPLVQD